MELCNTSTVTEFLIVGFTDFASLHIPLFLLFLLIYILTLTGNMILILVICWSPALYTPLYFFLCNLSALDIAYTSVTSPKLIHIFSTNNGIISFQNCVIQLYFFIAFGSTEYFLLTVMSYDRYVAICKPLHYTLIMNKKVCMHGVTCTWLGGIAASGPITAITANLTYSSSNIVNHFFCDVSALIKLASSDTTIIHTVILVQGVLLVMISFMLTLISYIHIIATILNIRSSIGKHKAFSTCASHLTIVSIFYFLVFSLYMRPTSTISLTRGKILSVLYVYFIPMLNPVIYSYRNKDVKMSLRKLLKCMVSKRFRELKLYNLRNSN